MVNIEILDSHQFLYLKSNDAQTKKMYGRLYTLSHTKLPTPITKSYMWHRHLNTEALGKNKWVVKWTVPVKTFMKIRGSCKNVWRKMTSDDITRVTKILQEYNKSLELPLYINEEYVKRRVLPIYSLRE